MTKRRQVELEPMPRSMKASLVAFAIFFLVLVFIADRYYLPNWKGSAIFLPIALFIGLLVIASMGSLMFRLLRKRR